MATPLKPNIEGLIRLLSSEAQPKYPDLRRVDWAVSLEKWIKELTLYLQKIFGKFTATNIIETIIENGGTGLGFGKIVHKSYHYKGTNTLTVVLDDTFDWRASLGAFCRITASNTGVIDNATNPTYISQGNSSIIAPFGGFPFTIFPFQDIGGVKNITIDATGKLLADLNGSGVHVEYWIDFVVAACLPVSNNAAEYSLQGNGL